MDLRKTIVLFVGGTKRSFHKGWGMVETYFLEIGQIHLNYLIYVGRISRIVERIYCESCLLLILVKHPVSFA